MREEAKLTLRDLGEKANINIGSLSKIERGLRKPTFEQSIALWQVIVDNLPEDRVRRVKKALGEDFEEAIEWNLGLEIKEGDKVLVKKSSHSSLEEDYIAVAGEIESPSDTSHSNVAKSSVPSFREYFTTVDSTTSIFEVPLEPYLLDIADKFDQFLKVGSQRVAISIPPQHGKSFLIKKLVDYIDNYYPDFRLWVIVGRNDQLSKMADGVTSENIVINTNSNIGVQGRAFDLILLDDVGGDISFATDSIKGDVLYNNFTSYILTRISHSGSVILLCSRWVEYDLMGRLEGLFNFINYPAISENGVLLNVKMGEVYEEVRKQNPGAFEALYQGNPSESIEFLTASSDVCKSVVESSDCDKEPKVDQEQPGKLSSYKRDWILISVFASILVCLGLFMFL